MKADKIEEYINQIEFELLKNRGPDSFQHRVVELSQQNACLVFASSVLSLRGGPNEQITVQPLVCNTTGNTLLWNGEIFGSDQVNVGLDENDSMKLFEKLNEPGLDLLKVFESIKGPYAFVFYEKQTNSVYFGRDRFGRRSLLISASTSDDKSSLTLSSVRVNLNKDSRTEYQELKANGIYKLDLENPEKLTLFKRQKTNQISTYSEIDNYIKHVEINESELRLNDLVSPFNEKLSDFNPFDDKQDPEYMKLVEELYSKLKSSVQKRVENIPNYCKACSHHEKLTKFSQSKPNSEAEKKCPHAKVAVLFSGGVDSAVLAALVDECLPKNEPIDLLNIAFEQISNKKMKTFMVPDRISGLETLKELNLTRKWNFVEVNVDLNELKTERENRIKHLLYPHQTVLDDSIGCALWFASRGIGINETSHAEVLFLGMGADEQLAGYSRHRTRYEMGGMVEFCNEVKMEIERISERNLGRDDRILSDHGL